MKVKIEMRGALGSTRIDLPESDTDPDACLEALRDGAVWMSVRDENKHFLVNAAHVLYIEFERPREDREDGDS